MNTQVKIAIPSVTPGGIGSACSNHFGHCDCFTLVTINGQETVGVEVVPNMHGEGCGSVVSQLRDAGTDIVMVKGIGRRPLMGFQQIGIKVLQGAGSSVGEVIKRYREGPVVVVDKRSSCRGHDSSRSSSFRS